MHYLTMLHALESISVINITCVYNHKKEYIMKYIRRLMLNLPYLFSLSMTIDVGDAHCCSKGKIRRPVSLFWVPHSKRSLFHWLLAYCLKVSSCLFFCPPSNIGWTKDSMQLIVHLSTAGVLVNFRKNSKAFSLGSVNIGQDLVVVFFLCSPTIMWPLPPFFIFAYDKRCWIVLHLSLTSMMQTYCISCIWSHWFPISERVGI